MKLYHLPMQPWMGLPASVTIIRILSQEGGEARFVGGCVRDGVLEKPVGEQGLDIDIACTHKPERVIELLEASGIRVIPTGLAHGTVTALCGGQHFEITTLRRDVACYGRHAEVEYTDRWEEDAARRDFTINALYATLDGEVYDYFGGVGDVAHGHVRFIGDAHKRIEEDALRILRFFRFFAYYGRTPFDKEAIAACSHSVSLLTQLSGERIQTEMLKLLLAEQAGEVLAEMQEHHIASAIGLPVREAGLQAMAALRQVENEVGRHADPILRLAALLQGTEAARVEALSERWRLSNAMKKRLYNLCVFNLSDVADWQEPQQKHAIRQLGKSQFTDVATLAWAYAGPMKSRPYAGMIQLARQWRLPTFPLTGDDLKAIGIGEGKELGEMLHKLEYYWEQQDYHPDKATLLHKAQDILLHQRI